MAHNKHFNIAPKNDEQKEALKALTAKDVDLVVLEGVAGSGKTLLALGAGLAQVFDEHAYSGIIFTRAPVGIGTDLGSLPGTEQEKMGPWCGGLLDNLEYLVGDNKMTLEFVMAKVQIKAMQFMRGRSLMNKYIIIDEAQNLSTAELKVLLTRAGEGTKVVVMGDSSQVDNRKLSTENNSLVDLIEAYSFYAPEFIKHISLPTSERSRLCSWIAQAL